MTSTRCEPSVLTGPDPNVDYRIALDPSAAWLHFEEAVRDIQRQVEEAAGGRDDRGEGDYAAFIRNDGHTCDASRQAAMDEAHRMVAPLFNVGDRVRVADVPVFTSQGGDLVSSEWVEHLAGVEGHVSVGPDCDGDYGVAPDSVDLSAAWVHGSCLTKIDGGDGQ